MTLPASGAISMSQVRTELGLSGAISLGQSQVRTLAGVPSGAIGMSNLRGKSAYTAMTITPTNASNWQDTQFGAGTNYCYPSVSVSNGTPGYTYLWAFTSNANGHVLTDATAASCSVHIEYANNSNYTGTSTLQCTIKDNNGAGNTVVQSGITAQLSGDGNN